MCESDQILTHLSSYVASLPPGYYAPPQTPPVVISIGANDWLYFFIAQDYAGRTYVWAGNGYTGEFLAAGIPTMARPDRFGFFRNCIVSRQPTISVFFPVASASTEAFDVVEAVSLFPDISSPIISNIAGRGASEFVFYTPAAGPHLVFVAWHDAYLNDVYAFSVQSSAMNSQLGANATYVSAEAGRLFWSTLTAWDASSGTVTQRIYYSVDPTQDPIAARLLEVPSLPIYRIELAEMFVPSPYAVVQDIFLFTDWGQPAFNPSVQVWIMGPVPALELTQPRSSVAWAMRISNSVVAWVGPSEGFANADEFVNAAFFTAFQYSTANSGSATDLLSPGQSHVYAAFAYPGEPRTLWAHNGGANKGPSAFYQMWEYKGNAGPFNPINPLLQCPGIETWVTYVRFPNDFNGTHMFFLAPSASGPTVYAQRANEPGTLCFLTCLV
jgi:hypothetical protein